MTIYAPAVVPNAQPAAWNPAPVITDGVPEFVSTAERPLRAVDVEALIPKEIG